MYIYIVKRGTYLYKRVRAIKGMLDYNDEQANLTVSQVRTESVDSQRHFTSNLAKKYN